MKFKDYILSEMSRASDRTLGKNSLENLLYILSDYLKKDGDPTYNRLSKFVEEYGLDWDTVAKQLGISPSLKTSKSKAHLEYLIINVANKNNIDLDTDRLSVEEDKDEADHLIDTFWDYYRAKHEADRATVKSIENGVAFDALVYWVKNKDKTVEGETAEQAFGRHYDTVLRILKPFLMDNWEGSPEQAIEEFWDWHRAKKAGKEVTLSKETLERLATILESDQAMYYFDNFYYYVAKEVGKMLGRKLLAPGEEPPLTKELKRIMAALDNPKVIDQIEAEEKRRVASGENGGNGGSSFRGGSNVFAAIPAAALRRIAAIASEDGAVDKNKVGKVDKAQVRQCYQYCMNQLNRKFHVGQRGAFDGSLQEFYDKFKIVFNRGYNIGTLKKIFDEVTTFLVDQLDQETANYWKNKEDVTLGDTDDFNEAVRVARKAGYKIVKESVIKKPETVKKSAPVKDALTESTIRELKKLGVL